MLFELRIILEIIIIILFVSVLFFQLFYIFNILLVIFQTKKTESNKIVVSEKISIIIPVFDSEKTVNKCLDSILKNNLSAIKSLIIVLDHCSDNSAEKIFLYDKKFKKFGVDCLILNLPGEVAGKVNAIKHGISFVKTKISYY